jgi:hypothetical protein
VQRQGQWLAAGKAGDNVVVDGEIDAFLYRGQQSESGGAS